MNGFFHIGRNTHNVILHDPNYDGKKSTRNIVYNKRRVTESV